MFLVMKLQNFKSPNAEKRNLVEPTDFLMWLQQILFKGAHLFATMILHLRIIC